jgi:L-lactate dehydrogenase (cytochrome)
MIGRAFAYGLGAAGEAGVSKAIEIIAKELDTSMALTGTRRIKNVSSAILA